MHSEVLFPGSGWSLLGGGWVPPGGVLGGSSPLGSGWVPLGSVLGGSGSLPSSGNGLLASGGGPLGGG
ncbi:hypothetical protein B7463_g9255, partial [Scytalidium lignicola]